MLECINGIVGICSWSSYSTDGIDRKGFQEEVIAGQMGR